ncbi:citrate lyase holo-[acyl-carrier protein] synthase [Suttonella ornithocola]|uniref:Triphosphoribosyl-dephospho-CoA synthase n=1 Tax=Suttonella ornithocola TaxID=279832 RepID=A0A380MMP7_9GAMM|nr:citrate lyase holo-[acyl-carrier protein] synthase [Suttonella ornithocola]SUO93326.1 triphosphoribosyl-dephospho-CoA synthase [Suttonella ornithocola]
MNTDKLTMVLAARDARQQAQQSLLQSGVNSVVSFSVLAPGEIKRSPFLDKVFLIGRQRIYHYLHHHGFSLCDPIHLNHSGGESWLIGSTNEATSLKSALMTLEQYHPLGRLWDIDVLDNQGIPLSRQSFHQLPRRCLCCADDAKSCAKTRRHSYLALQAAMQSYWQQYQDCQYIALQMEEALITEANLTPKPGLVDTDNQGPHPDMSLSLFHHSAKQLTPYFAECIFIGRQFSEPSPDIMTIIRPIGQEAERAMFSATNGINTHKGAIFFFCLLAAAIGCQPRWSSSSLSENIAIISTDLKKELGQGKSAGADAYRHYQITGARGEALNGFSTVFTYALPAYWQAFAQTGQRDHALRYALLVLFAHNNDTTTLKRGGMTALHWLQQTAKIALKDKKLIQTPQALITTLKALDMQCNIKNLSTGGSADLLALTAFLSHFFTHQEQL